jgi:NAD-dependent dihydropyrimidine dehydrogenase PreA subunit
MYDRGRARISGAVGPGPFLQHYLCKRDAMTYVIGKPCVDAMDRACVEECPVDCIYEGGRALYIHPDECVDCGACEPVCPVQAIYYQDDLPEDLQPHLADNEAFFTQTLPGRDEPLGRRAGPPRSAHSASTRRW